MGFGFSLILIFVIMAKIGNCSRCLEALNHLTCRFRILLQIKSTRVACD